MKNFQFLIVALGVIIATSCNAQNNSKKKVATTMKGEKVEAYYFHFTARCVTCKVVEAETKKNIETLYPEQVKSGKVSFRAVNLDDATSKELAEKNGVYGQALLIVSGSQKINITNEGFMYAKNNPDKFRQIIKEKIDKLL